MHFIIVREPSQGRIVHQEILDPEDTERDFDDPYWDTVSDCLRDLEARFPGARVIEGMSPSIESFLRDHPEYGPLIS